VAVLCSWVAPRLSVGRVRVAEWRADAVVPELEHHSLVPVGQVVAVVHPDPGVGGFECHLPHLVQVPIVLGRGVRIWDGLEALEDVYDVEAVSSPSGVTHLTFTRKVAS
jgi:hypothetical protein